MNYMNIYRDKA